MRRAAAATVMVAALSWLGSVPVATASPPFRTQASQLCERILNQIVQTPASVKISQVTSANGDKWLS